MAEQIIGKIGSARVVSGLTFTSATAISAPASDGTLQTWAKYSLGYRAPSAPGTLVTIAEVAISGTTTAAGAAIPAFAPVGMHPASLAGAGGGYGIGIPGSQTQAQALAGTSWGLGAITSVSPLVPAHSVLTLTLSKGTTGLATPAGLVHVF